MIAKKRQLTDAEGNVYKGDVVGGLMHGSGTLVYGRSQDLYQGDFENDLPHGAGKYIRAGGGKDGTYEGLWEEGELVQVKKGRAKIVEKNGDVYEGGFHHWKRHGQGVLQKANGEIYNGQFKDGVPNGQGIIQYKDGKTFEGYFKDGKPHDRNRLIPHREKAQSESDDVLNPYHQHESDENVKPRSLSRSRSHRKEESEKREPTHSSRNRSFREEEMNDNYSKDEKNIPRVISFISDNEEDDATRDQGEGSQSRSFGRTRSQSRTKRNKYPNSPPVPPATPTNRSSSRLSSQRKMSSNDLSPKRTSSRLSRMRSETDPLEMKRKQLENLRDQKNLRKFIMATQIDTNKKDSRHRGKEEDDEEEDDDLEQKGRGFFSFFKKKSSPKSNEQPQHDFMYEEDEPQRDDDARHFQSRKDSRARGSRHEDIPQSPEDSEIYEEAEVRIEKKHFNRTRSLSRPEVRREEDYEPTTRQIYGRNEKTPERSRSMQRKQSSGRNGSRMRLGIGRSRSRSRSRTREKSSRQLDDAELDQNSGFNELPPTAPKRSSSTHRRKEITDNLHRRDLSRSNSKRVKPRNDEEIERHESYNSHRSSSGGTDRARSQSNHKRRSNRKEIEKNESYNSHRSNSNGIERVRSLSNHNRSSNGKEIGRDESYNSHRSSSNGMERVRSLSNHNRSSNKKEVDRHESYNSHRSSSNGIERVRSLSNHRDPVSGATGDFKRSRSTTRRRSLVNHSKDSEHQSYERSSSTRRQMKGDPNFVRSSSYRGSSGTRRMLKNSDSRDVDPFFVE